MLNKNDFEMLFCFPVDQCFTYSTNLSADFVLSLDNHHQTLM